MFFFSILRQRGLFCRYVREKLSFWYRIYLLSEWSFLYMGMGFVLVPEMTGVLFW